MNYQKTALMVMMVVSARSAGVGSVGQVRGAAGYQPRHTH